MATTTDNTIVHPCAPRWSCFVFCFSELFRKHDQERDHQVKGLDMFPFFLIINSGRLLGPSPAAHAGSSLLLVGV